MEQKPDSETPLSIQRLQVEDFQRVALADITLSRTGLVLIRGKNEHGKTSLIEAALETLGIGKSAMPIRKGAHNSKTLLDLGDVIVRGHWTKDAAGKAKRSLSVESPPGEQVARPAEVLKKLRGHMADPSIFSEMKSPEQAKMILAVLGIDERLTSLEGVERKHFDERTNLGREKDRTAKAFATLYEELEGVPERETGVSMAELAESLREAQESNTERMLQESRKANVERIAAVDAGRVIEIDKEIENLQAERAQLEELKETHRTNWRDAEQKLIDSPERDLEPLREGLRDAEAAAQAVGKRELLTTAEADAIAAATAHADADDAVVAARAAITELLGSVEFPVEGMTYDAESKTILVNGLPSGQWSQAQRIRIAATVAMSGKPRLKVIFAREGSLIDADGQALLHELAVEKGYLFLLEVVDSKREGEGIWIEDGIATQEFDTGRPKTVAAEVDEGVESSRALLESIQKTNGGTIRKKVVRKKAATKAPKAPKIPKKK